MGAAPRDVATVRVHARPELTENSAAAMSTTQLGVLFTINDSGNEPLLFALDTMGADRGVWRVLGARNVDWESASVGACAAGGECVYIGDTGDNYAHHRSRAIYRVPEPTASGAAAIGSVRADELSYTYADGPHDVEAMYVAPNGDIVLITKRPLTDAAARLRPALMFRIPASAWNDPGIVVAALVDSLPIVPGSAALRLITDASLAPDGHHLAVRTYAQVYVFATDSLTGRVNHDVAPGVCNIVPLGEPQGEGITWANARGRFVFTSEGRATPLLIADCPLPR